MEEKDFRNIEEKLSDILKVGRKQADERKVLINEPVEGGPLSGAPFMKTGRDGIWLPNALGAVELETDPELFFLQNVEQFWSLFEHALSILDKPALQFLMRPLMEMAYSKIIYFSSKSQKEQKQLAVKYYLCLYGLINKGGFRDEQYRYLLEMLDDPSVKEKFSSFSKRGYPKGEIQKYLGDLLKTVLDPNIAKSVKKILDELWDGDAPDAKNLDIQFRYKSMLSHADPVMIRQLDLEKKDKNYLLRCAKIMHLTGVSVIALCEKKLGWIVDPRSGFEDLKNKFGKYLLHLYSERNKTRPTSTG